MAGFGSDKHVCINICICIYINWNDPEIFLKNFSHVKMEAAECQKRNLLDSRSIYAWIYIYIHTYEYICKYNINSAYTVYSIHMMHYFYYNQPLGLSQTKAVRNPVRRSSPELAFFREVLVKFLRCKIGGVPSPKPSWNFVPGSLSFHPWPLYWLEVWGVLFWGGLLCFKNRGHFGANKSVNKELTQTQKEELLLKGKSSCEELFGWLPSICSCNPVSENYRTYLPTVPKVHVVETCNDVLIGTCNSVNRFLYNIYIYRRDSRYPQRKWIVWVDFRVP